MLKLRHILLILLLFGIATLWVPARWARSALESAVFLAAAARIAWRAWRGVWLPASFPLAALLGVCLWTGAQLCFRWTAVQALTREALLYWLAAACLVWLGSEACQLASDRLAFLKSAVAAGAIICFAGIAQLHTSLGQVFWLFPSGYDSGVIGPFVSANNFACFVELLLPAAVALSPKGRAGSMGYLLAAGALAAAVVASGSRTGAVMVAAESALLFAWRRRIAGPTAGRQAGLAFGLCAAAGALIFGSQSLFQRISESRDSYVLRREFLLSALAMFRARPLRGFGFGVWPSVYRQFARLDAGALVDHAHNEWAQWAAEGGLVALVLLAAVFVWCWKPALQRLWGLGIIAIFLHSLVDYPFARLGLAAWVFVWIGALAAAGSVAAPATGVVCRPCRLSRMAGAMVGSILLLAVCDSARLAYADSLYRRGDRCSVAHAVRLCPDRAEYWAAMAQAEPEEALPHFRRALALDPYLTGARISLAAELEQRGDLRPSESALLEAARLDRQLAPAWAAANFYFRAGRSEEFWFWAGRTAGLARGDLDSLFDLCFLMDGDVARVEGRAAGFPPEAQRQLLDYLVAEGRGVEAYALALPVARTAPPAGRNSLLDYIDQTLPAGEPRGAVEVWNEICTRGLLPLPPVREGTLVNGDFQWEPINRGFDWRLASPPGVLAICGQKLLKLTFSGRQPESGEILSQWITLRTNTPYRLRFAYRTDGLPRETGLLWSIAAQPQSLIDGARDWNWGEYRFQAGSAIARLRLSYRRLPGSTRIAGSLWLRQISLETLLKSEKTADKT